MKYRVMKPNYGFAGRVANVGEIIDESQIGDTVGKFVRLGILEAIDGPGAKPAGSAPKGVRAALNAEAKALGISAKATMKTVELQALVDAAKAPAVEVTAETHEEAEDSA